MPDFDKPHFNISNRVIRRSYQAPSRNMGGGSAPRVRAEHAARLDTEFNIAFAGADEARPSDPRLEAPTGVYLEVELRGSKRPDDVLQRKSDGIIPGAAKRSEAGDLSVALFVPDDARPVLEAILNEYRSGPTNRKGEPPKKDKIEPIESVRQARLETFWTDDPRALPQQATDAIWWEIWCYKDKHIKVADVAAKLGCNIADDHYWLQFPESTVIQVYTDRVTLELLLFASGGIAELRRGSSSPTFFLDMDAEDQLEWSEDLAGRIRWPYDDAPAVCILDTGVNRGHMLIEPALSAGDVLSVDNAWGGDDHNSHGTKMAGVSLLGDLLPHLEGNSVIALTHRAESVKILPPGGFPANNPMSYGSITQSALSVAEINNPERHRVCCLAVTNEDVSGARATTWSSAIDQACAGAMPGDDKQAPKRLFVISAGNAPEHIDPTLILDAADLPIEDPAQSWNALTAGGYTDKTEIDEPGYQHWEPMAEAGDLSPYSRTSISWTQGRSPIKPEVVFEAGNRAMNPSGNEALTFDSLSLVTTGHNSAQHPLVPFGATSAAAAQAGRLAARLMADHPDLWPETIRALIVHSAEWTPIMLEKLDNASGLQARYPILRTYGYGVPDYGRANASATNHLALVAQNYIVPFITENGSKKFGDCHLYPLPWPVEVLQELGEQDVKLKVTLSYFIEPNPGRFASIDAQRYQSFGLRFDLKRRTESEQNFIERINAKERDDPRGAGPRSDGDSGWRFGPKSISAGSLHCDEWMGPAAHLAARDMICIKPVTGWWKDSARNCNRKVRYALAVTLSTPDADVDLYTPIKTIIENQVGISIET
ncbi:S8 family peptidase [Ponticaulis sp.]|uniref:S8 family peptidase n=1 Tax=Ponticaulis sp. TaxID=2020902 RepID=UPI000B66AB6D|nr:S8 family peptidase [Ponticaulis sp.]MAJ09229.1 peptidase S8 family protein [Ponticaulis sp.]|tara:strand:+ start:34356 stop:36830 length:2475 start_codon:yes stop_codon:yes gene_type:complete